MVFASEHQFLAWAADTAAMQVLESERYLDAVKAALDETGKWEQRECPMKAPLVMWLVCAGTLHRSESLASILTTMLSQYREHHRTLSLRAVKPEAACKARARLGAAPVANVYHRLAEDIRGTVGFLGLRSWAVDGTFLSLPEGPENDKEFGRPKASRGETAYPQLHKTSLIDTMTREVKDAVIGRSDKVDERCDTGRLIEHLGPGDVLFMDCGISATWLFGKCRDRGIDFVGRISNSWKPKILKTLGDGDYLVSVSAYVPDAYRGAACSVRLKLRMIAYQVGDDEPVRVLTSLRDPGKYPPREIALGYHLRWESELTFDEQKVHFVALQHGKQKTVFRSKTPEGVRQEVYGLLICYNLIRRLMLEAAATANVDPRYLSFVDSVRLIKLATTAYQKRCTPEWQAAVLNQLLADVAQTLNPRPRRPRHYPRLVKIKMSNYGCKTRTRGAGRHRDYVSELRNKPVVPPQLASSLAWLSSLLTALASQGPVSALVLLATDATLLKP